MSRLKHQSLTQVSQSGQSRTFAYTSLGRLLSATNPENSGVNNTAVGYTYDNNGNLLTRTDARSIKTTTIYDALNRVTSKSYTDTTPAVSYTYGTSSSQCGSFSIGRLCSVANSVSTTNYTQYDEAGRVSASAQTTSGTPYTFSSYTYTMLSGLASETYPSGRTVSYTYDAGGRVNSVTGQAPQSGPTTHYASNIGYAPQHALSSLSLANGLSESWTYNSRLQTVQIQAGSLLTLGYGYGTLTTGTANNGNVTSANIGFPNGAGTTNIQQVFTYDSVNRLSVASESSSNPNAPPCPDAASQWCQGYSYDAFGNRSVPGSSGLGASSLTPVGFSTSTNQITDANWAYDAAGNVTQQPGTDTFAYDAENRQTAYCMGGASTCPQSSATEQYFYDGDGKRVQTQGGGVTTTFVYDATGQLVAEYGSAAPPCSATCYVTVDALGSTRMVTDQSGSVISRQDYLPFGQTILVSSGNPRYGVQGYGDSGAIRQQFTSKERDSESGLDFFNARYMSSAQGRFTSPDPSNLSVDFWLPQTWNRYSYGVNNPLSIVDKNGLWPTWVHNAIINEAFPGLSKDQLTNLQAASKNVDSDQSLAGAYKHGMANGQDPNGAVHAEMDSDEFIRKNQHDAESIQADWIASGHTGIAPGALTAFGNALHTITDKTSPSHEYFLPWYGTGVFDLPEAGYHFVLEAWPWGGNQQRQQNAVNAARAAFLIVFGSDAASQAETPKKKEDVSSKVCYQTDNGQVCQ